MKIAASCVLDASAVASALFQEAHADKVARTLSSGVELFVPDLIYAEIGNVIWKRHGRGEIKEAEASEMMQDLLQLPWEVTPSQTLALTALTIALRTRRTVYNCTYLALAMEKQSRVVTADQRLINALSHGPFAKYLLWSGDL